MRVLPAHVGELTGLRAARWFRESTTGQFDAFGPDSQREQQDRAIDQFGLIDTGIEWSVAASGWTEVWHTHAFKSMLDAAGRDFDVLAVPYFSRFMRNVKQALIFRDEIHARGLPSTSVTSVSCHRTSAVGMSGCARPPMRKPSVASCLVEWARAMQRSAAASASLAAAAPRSATHAFEPTRETHDHPSSLSWTPTRPRSLSEPSSWPRQG